MDEQAPVVCMDESFNGNLRIRLYRFKTNAGDVRHTVEVAAWNAWAGQPKLISLVGGLELPLAKELFEDLRRSLRGYDWVSGECVLADEH